MTLEKLTGCDAMKSQGSWVFTDQGVAEKDGFRNVSQHWMKNTMTYEEGIQMLEAERAKTEDVICSLTAMKPRVNEAGKFVVADQDGRSFVPTNHAITQMGKWSDAGSWYVESLLGNPTDAKGRERYQRDRQDAETLVKVLENGFRRVDPQKKFLWRTRQDGTLRAMLSTEYARVDNRWFIESLAKIVPGGRLSHWRGDQDTIYGNVLIPDTLRQETDSDYGGMLSIGNSEIGERRVTSYPSIFRAICQNGCVWGKNEGKAIKFVHRGKLNLPQLFLEIQTNLTEQIPLLPVGIQTLLGVRKYGWDGASMLPLFAELANEFSLSKKQASGLLAAYNVERGSTPDTAKTLFGVIASVTRAGQLFGNAEWVRFDEIGGQLLGYDDKDWAFLTGRAKNLKAKEVEEAFSSSVA